MYMYCVEILSIYHSCFKKKCSEQLEVGRRATHWHRYITTAIWKHQKKLSSHHYRLPSASDVASWNLLGTILTRVYSGILCF